jgi:hypothetical protein
MGVATGLMDEALMVEVALPEAVDPDGTETEGITPEELADDSEMLSDETELVESTLVPFGGTVFPDDNEMLSDVGEPVGGTLAPDDSVPDDVRPDTVALPEGRTLPEGDTLLPVGSGVPSGSERLSDSGEPIVSTNVLDGSVTGREELDTVALPEGETMLEGIVLAPVGDTLMLDDGVFEGKMLPVGEALTPKDERELEGSVPEESELDTSTVLDEKAEIPEDRPEPDGLIDADWLIEPPDGKDDVVVSPRMLESKSVGATAVADKLLDSDTDAEINGGALTLDEMLLDVLLGDVPSGNASQTSTASLPPPDWVLLPVLGVVHSAGVLSANALGSVFPQ